jgi:hypothetical protein
MLRKIFGPKEEEARGCRNCKMKSSMIILLTKSRTMKRAGHVARYGENRNARRVLVGKLKEKRPFGRPRLRSENNIKIGYKEIVSEGVDWSYLAEVRDK